MPASDADLPRIALPRLEAAVRLVCAGFGSAPDEVDAVASNLIEANLRGHDSHGIGMLPRYADAFLEGGLVPNARPVVVHDGGALVRLDAQRGFGQVAGFDAMALAVERTRRHGTAVVALGHAHHLGRIGAWAEQCAEAGFVSLHFVNVVARPIVAPYGGSDARFGTNPVCIGVPLAGRPPVILDFATSTIAQGKTRVAHNRGVAVEPGCLLDAEGRPSTDPRWTVVPPFGALLAFGGALGEHKGYGLALVAELLGGALAGGLTGGANSGGGEPDARRVWNGMLSIVVDPAALGATDRFEAEATAFCANLRASPPRDGFGAVQLAGEPELAARERRRAQGVPVDPTTWTEILAAAARLGVDPLAVDAAAGPR